MFSTDANGVVRRHWHPDDADTNAEEIAKGYTVHTGHALPNQQKLVDSSLIPYQPEVPVEFARSQAKAMLDQAAENMRGAWITQGSGQAMTYDRKFPRAEQVLAEIAAGNTPDPANYPLLAPEIGATGASLEEVAALIVTNAAAWETVAGAIEGARLHGKAAVDAATTVAEIETAKQAALMSLDQIGASSSSLEAEGAP